MQRITVFIASFLVWCGLVWPYDQARVATDGTAWDTQSLLVGVLASLLVAILFGEALTRKPVNLFNPSKIIWFIMYLPVFFFYCIRANLQVMYLVVHPDMPIKPGIVKVKTKLTSDSGVTALANSITLTPGTLTIDVVNKNELYVHWLVVEETDVDKATKKIVEKFEYFLGKTFE